MAKGISVHIGINRLDPVCYPRHSYRGWESAIVVGKDGCVNVEGDFTIGWNGRLGRSGECCEKDAMDMAAIAGKQGFETKLLLTEKATADEVQKEIRSAANNLVAGDIFLLTYAGHGSQVEDLTDDEIDNEDETWCLYDRMFLDDEQRALYTEFGEGVRILVLCDSCHSGTATRSGGLAGHMKRNTFGQPMARAMPRETAKSVYYARQAEYDQIQRSLQNPPPELRASRILLSACQDSEEAMGDAENGKFTRALKKVWNDGEFKGNYQQFAEEIKLELERDYAEALRKAGGDASGVNRQVPNFVAVSAGEWPAHLAEFVAESPFSI